VWREAAPLSDREDREVRTWPRLRRARSPCRGRRGTGPTRTGAIALDALVLVLLPQPAGATILVVAVPLLVLAVIEFRTRTEPAASAPPATAAA
jgi:hypothetical protein